MEHYAPPPTNEQLRALGADLGGVVVPDHRIVGGLGGTMDVLRLGANGRRVVLKRYWMPEDDEHEKPAESEYRILTLAREHGVPAPEPIWIDRTGLFPERAVVMSFLEGRVILDPADPMDWAAQLATTLQAIHRIEPSPADDALFPTIDSDDGHSSEEAVKEHSLGEQLWHARLEGLGALVPGERVYSHHDYWPGNTLWVDQDLVAVVDWEGGCIADPALDVAYCALDLRLLGLDRAAAHFIDVYRRVSRRALENLRYWQLTALCRPMPDISIWVPGWQAMGVEVTLEAARARHAELIQEAIGSG